MTVILVFVVVYIIAKLATCGARPARRAPELTEVKTVKQMQAECRLRQQERREEERIWKEQERRKQQALKAAQQAEKDRQAREQAEADIAFLRSQLDQICELLNEADTELERIEHAIQIDIATRSYESEQKDRKTRERVQKRIIQYESRIHSLEKRLVKARYTLTA